MIHPDNITNYSRTDDELLEFFIFCVFVAGHNSHSTAQALDNFLKLYVGWKWFEGDLLTCLKDYVSQDEGLVPQNLQSSGIGCYRRNAQFLKQVCEELPSLDLRTASVEELEAFKGVGPKTSRFFVLHSRKGVENVAVLDVHILRWMGQQGVKVPKATPSGKRYRDLEKTFLKMAKASGKSVADFDLEIWKSRRVKGK